VTERIRVDPSNPGQVFACLGLLEVASLIKYPATGRFDWNRQQTHASFELVSDASIDRILTEVRSAEVTQTAEKGPLWEMIKESAEEQVEKVDLKANESSKTAPVQLKGPSWTLIIDAWLEPDTRVSNRMFKTWAGRVGSIQLIQNLKNVLEAAANISEIFEWGIPMRPVGYDCRSAVSADDLGYYYNKVSDVAVYPVVDLFALIGLNHARPTNFGNNKFEYCIWSLPLPPEGARAAITGAIPWFTTSKWRATVESRGNFKTWSRGRLVE
jgi:CRISPR-associated protein Csx14